MTIKESIIPKAYIFTLSGIKDDEDLPIKMSVASFGITLEEESLDQLVSYACNLALDKYPELKDESLWPQTIKFYKTLKSRTPLEKEVFLSFSPVFMIQPENIVVTKDMLEAQASKPTKRSSKPKASID